MNHSPQIALDDIHRRSQSLAFDIVHALEEAGTKVSHEASDDIRARITIHVLTHEWPHAVAYAVGLRNDLPSLAAKSVKP